MKRIIITIAISTLYSTVILAQTNQSNRHEEQTPLNAGKNNFEVIDHVKYELMDTVLFNLYRTQKPIVNAKGFPPYATYYFFKTTNNKILPLTIQYLKEAYPSVPSFHYALDAHFRSDAELIAWDPWQHVYKVKYLLNQALQNKAN
jgi:hypothetical protein